MGGGRPWHWLAAGTAAVAVVVAVMVNDTSGVSSLISKPYSAIEYTPDVGNPVLATPTMDATTVTQTTTTPPAPPPAKPTPPSNKPPARTPQHRHQPPPQTKWTITIPVPGFPWYFPDCETAKVFGAAPLRRGHPSYRDDLDNDHDGVACDR
ncbi:excalibur calcium-binding domain-containing protein [Kibdelosporangium phytohabitans]|uniref:Excalibur calcium-binding domain-containing protein n=1 Tax=Kibdelosporangium phytohabitans TaxID=860235 RepID=A0A0N9HIH4_9PSEU|nr:excalibur calcium-binding domain-containing protein [Kibdelosporangium phytohabitans]ALG05708.1 hypothetical protein AOZ06_01095 [Kibdelosporangium phytohabitans]MBE1466303.1 hypothetical protein [Kibdelosporangium phytohabitans]